MDSAVGSLDPLENTQSQAEFLLTGAIIKHTMINDTITIRPMVPLSSTSCGGTTMGPDLTVGSLTAGAEVGGGVK